MNPEEQIAKDKKTKVYLLIIIGVLFIINFALLYNLISKDKILVTTETKLEDAQVEKNELDKMMKETENLLLEYKGRNEELDSIIDDKNDEIASKIAQIRQMLSDKNLTRKQLEDAKKEIAMLKVKIARETYVIDSLSRENDQLKEAFAELSEENITIKEEFEEQKTENANLSSTNKTLSDKVRKASRLTATNIKVDGIMMRGTKEREKSKLSRIDKIKVQFNIDKNEIADAGIKIIYLRLVGPDGSTVSNETAGSGVFEVAGESMKYTSKAKVNFDNAKGSSAIIYFDKIPGMVAGTYKSILYCDEFVMGEGELKLR
ncbi:MAG: hypothetical protein H6605_03000 [Flavobacteriales bacterium]|nr:hypothetical protein [Flavobacteriales bacterium]